MCDRQSWLFYVLSVLSYREWMKEPIIFETLWLLQQKLPKSIYG